MFERILQLLKKNILGPLACHIEQFMVKLATIIIPSFENNSKSLTLHVKDKDLSIFIRYSLAQLNIRYLSIKVFKPSPLETSRYIEKSVLYLLNS